MFFPDADVEIGGAAVHDEGIEPLRLATTSRIMDTLVTEGGV